MVVAMFVLPLAVAALWDLASFRIPNLLPLALLVLFPVAVAVSAVPVAWGWHLAAGAVVLAVGAGLFALGLLGGGDAKLMAAAALWLGSGNLLGFLLVTSLAGGVLTLVILLLRAAPVRTALAGMGLAPAVLRPRGGIPYGVAIAVGGAALVQSLPMVGG
jgi:prepilin peptidase CpaA